MKKKIIITIALVLILSFGAAMLVGCDEIFKMNAERDAHQTVASVSYKNQSANVYKFELTSSFNSYAYLYVNYYGMTYQGAADYIVKSLAQRELLVLFAKEYLATAADGDDADPTRYDYYSTVPGAKNLLTSSEYDKAIRTVNDDLLSALETKIKNYIDEENRGSLTDADTPDYFEGDSTQIITLKFNSNGGSSVSDKKINNGANTAAPAAPTKDGYKFYGWYLDKDLTGDAVNFDNYRFTVENYSDKNTKRYITMYAKWEEYTAPRPEFAKPEEEDKDKDYDPDGTVEELSIRFFGSDGKVNSAFRETIDFKEKDFYKDIKADNDSDRDKKLEKFITDGINSIAKDMRDGFKSYEYYIISECKSLLTTKLERVIGKASDVTKAEIEARFAALAAENKATFGDSESAYASALQSALATTYLQKLTITNGDVSSYGFVNNILLKLDQDSMDELIELAKSGVVPNAVLQRRDEMLKNMEIKVSNPKYDSTFVEDYGKDEDGNVISVIDPMTDPNNPYNGVGDNKDNKYNENNDYNKIVSFGYKDGKWEITFNAEESPAMAYLIDKVPAFSPAAGGKIGIVEQIYESFYSIVDAVDNGVSVEDETVKLTHVESVYWMRKMADAWLHLVGDDGGGLNSESNNGGLGYLITPEGQDSNYLVDFTNRARELIKKGTGSYTTTDAFDGSYVFADSLVVKNEDGTTKGTFNTSNSPYAGIFIIFASHVVWDPDNAYTVEKDSDGNYVEKKIEDGMFDKSTGLLPLGYIVSYGETLEDCVTIEQQIKTELEDGKKVTRYNMIVNTFGIKHSKNISYNDKAYKSLWKNLDK